MFVLSEYRETAGLHDRLRSAHAVTDELMSEIVGGTGRRTEKARIERLIETGAWTDAALALIELELPQWRLRRIAYDGGEWHCALSRQRELPEWLDQSIEGHHADLPLAILSALVDAREGAAPASRTSVPTVPRNADAIYEPVLSDNFA
jgi:hypothetical protein